MIVLARLAAAIATGALPCTHHDLAAQTRQVGVSNDDVLGTLVAIAPIVGSSRVTEAAPYVAAMTGYDVDRALESLLEPESRHRLTATEPCESRGVGKP